MDDLLIEAGRIVTLDDDLGIVDDAAMLLRNGRVLAMGPRSKVGSGHKGPRISLPDGVVMPGLVNGHMHLYSTFARGMAIPGEPAANFPEILERLWWRLDKALHIDDLYETAVPPLVESLRHGVTTIFDHHASPNAIEGSLDRLATACRDVGLRASLCYEVSDRDGAEVAAAGIAENRRFLQRLVDQPDPHLHGLFGLHAAFTLSDETLRAATRAAKAVRAGYHIHVAEDVSDQEHAQTHHGTSTVKRLNRMRILGPRTIAAHCVHVDDDEIALLAQTKTYVVSNPQSNMNNAVGAAGVLRLLEGGVAMALGTDGMSGDTFQDAKALSLIHRHEAGDPRVGWNESMAIALKGTQDLGARHFAAPVGVLRPGAFADFVVRDYFAPTPMTGDNVWGHYLFGLGTAPVRHVFVGGRQVLEEGKVLGVDEATVARQAREKAGALWERIQ